MPRLPILVKQLPLHASESGILLDLVPDHIGWNYAGLKVLRLGVAEFFSGEVRDEEVVIVILSGRADIKTSWGDFLNVGGRRTVFDGLPFALYLPPDCSYTLFANTALELALASANLAKQKDLPAFPAHLIPPYEVQVEDYGDANASRQIYHIVKPEFRAHKIMVAEVLTPSGNWASYPPHKHDRLDLPEETELEEIFYYRIDGMNGFAIQRVYTKDRDLDETLVLSDGDAIAVPEGYHLMVAAHGYWVYYLSVMAGVSRSLAASDDPDHAWIRKIWRSRFPPTVTRAGKTNEFN
ncbi:MAG: 5-deoxy-glucuronate isomerase [Cyanobacteria bacterium NC_groundwater_1444_Ag_S-0.65um_54_12]|nr:5-deoxy-glucuronate isomerase [Cyanobacteria bacterium NC_groundwater_1444_Ag_S-0.65um_54_12]